MRSTPAARPSPATAAMPADIAAPTSLSVGPAITISSKQPTSGVSSLFFDRPMSVGQNASLVDALAPVYFEPTFEPERTTPPGNGMITAGSLRIAATAASAAAIAV